MEFISVGEERTSFKHMLLDEQKKLQYACCVDNKARKKTNMQNYSTATPPLTHHTVEAKKQHASYEVPSSTTVSSKWPQVMREMERK